MRFSNHLILLYINILHNVSTFMVFVAVHFNKLHSSQTMLNKLILEYKRYKNYVFIRPE